MRARRMRVIFSDTELRDAKFVSANMKDVVFREEVKIERADFHGANLQKANFEQAYSFLTGAQLESVLSIHDTNNTKGRLRDRNLLNYDNVSCNASLLTNWTNHIGKIKVLSQGSNCNLTLDTNHMNASLSKSISVSQIWDWNLWPSTYAMLDAMMTNGVRIDLFGMDINDRVLVQKTMSEYRNECSNNNAFSLLSILLFTVHESKSVTHLRMRLNKDMQQLRVRIHFQSNSANHTGEVWCSGLELFLDYGTEAENRAGQ